MGHLGEARFAAIIDNVLVRFTLGRKEVSKRIYGCELASMTVEQVDSLMRHIVQKITRLVHDLQESMTSTNEQVTFEYSRFEPLDICQAKIIQPWTGQGEKELDVYADYIHIVYY
ncbi:hypothetical protein QFC21_007328 [Naganishia friedmannii]|uniref:Uncharacterized protein n=1 Tax=Naganishia friedmannii TaxID=89922 RepID=A0ACC2UVH4_9TREE|nr:hypothetical protein QFC21_007328 [Naganishia friedmannii]